MTQWAVRDTLSGATYRQPNRLIAEKVAEMYGWAEVIEMPDVRQAWIETVNQALHSYDMGRYNVRAVAHMLQDGAPDRDRDERLIGYLAAQFTSDVDYDGAEVIRRIRMSGHLLEPDHPKTAAECPVCVDDDKLDGVGA